MKRLVAVALMIGVLGLAGCGAGEPAQPTEPSTVQTTEQMTEPIEPITEEVTTTKHYPPPVPPKVVNTDYVFGENWARTLTHFFGICQRERGEDEFSLYRAPLSNIAKKEEILLPKEYERGELRGVSICGISEQWLYVSCWNGDMMRYILFRVSLRTLEVTTVDDGESINTPIHYTASKSLLFVRGDENRENNRLEALQLDTAESTIIYDVGKSDAWCHWRITADGMVAFEQQWSGNSEESDFVVIDKDNRAIPMTFDEIKFGFSSIGKAGRCNYELTIEDKTYSLQSYPHPEYAGYDIAKLQTVDANGNVTATLAEGFWGENNGYSIVRLDDMVLMVEYGIYGNSDGYFHALYDPATGAVFP